MSDHGLPFLPTREEELLLKGIFLDGDAAIESWTEWRKHTTVDALDFPSQRLLPLLYNRLSALGVAHPDIERYKSVARYRWTENQLHLRQAAHLLGLLNGVEANMLLLGGCALEPLYYRDLGLRPVDDFSLLVPWTSVTAVISRFASAGWKPAQDAKNTALRPSVIVFHRKLHDIEPRLQRHVLRDCYPEYPDERFWGRPRTISIQDASVPTLGDTSQFFCVCAQGTGPDAIWAPHWVADALAILRGAPVDWRHLLNQVQVGGLVRRFRHALAYLKETFAVAIPDSIIAELAASPLSVADRVEAILMRRQLSPALARAGHAYLQYRRNSRFPGSPSNFLGHIQMRWGLRSPIHVLPEAVRRVARLRHKAA